MYIFNILYRHNQILNQNNAYSFKNNDNVSKFYNNLNNNIDKSKSNIDMKNLSKNDFFEINLNNISNNNSNELYNHLKLHNIKDSGQAYSKVRYIKDFFIQLFSCCYKNHQLVIMRRNIEDKINHAVSIELLLEKIYMIEILTSQMLGFNQEVRAHNYYVQAMKNSGPKNTNLNYIFDLSKYDK